MRLQDLIIEFLRGNGLKLTEQLLEDTRPLKLIRFVKGNMKYSIVFSNKNELDLHLFKEKLWAKRPYKSVGSTSYDGRKIGNPNYKRAKIVIDMNDKESFKQILDFL